MSIDPATPGPYQCHSANFPCVGQPYRTCSLPHILLGTATSASCASSQTWQTPYFNQLQSDDRKVKLKNVHVWSARRAWKSPPSIDGDGCQAPEWARMGKTILYVLLQWGWSVRLEKLCPSWALSFRSDVKTLLLPRTLNTTRAAMGLRVHVGRRRGG